MVNLKRASGVLMPLTALPSPYGIGTLGKAARDFADFLAEAGQKYWQVLPVGPISYGDSPYQSFSTFAGNPYLVDLDLLIADGLLTQAEADAPDWGSDPAQVDYGKIYRSRFDLLAKAAARGLQRDMAQVEAFVAAESAWLPDYALFMALKRRYGMKPWYEWPDESIRLHRREACDRAYAELDADVGLFIYIQFLFYRQWDALKAYAADKGIEMIGDVPIYVAMDSADVWAEPEKFQLNAQNIPTEVSGVPPDYFNADGQLWGNPLYRWDEMEKDGFAWWKRRLHGAFRLFDMIRFDHFRGLESYWAVPYGEKTAKNGRWVKGPGKPFLDALHTAFADKKLIAEDLGYLTEGVRELLRYSGYPGMRVLEFAFEGGGSTYYMPHSCPEQSICYIGTHDNTPALGWLASADADSAALAKRYLGLNAEEGGAWGFIRGGMGSPCALFIAQMQDVLSLGAEARINTPGTSSGNWTWRMQPGAADKALARKLLEISVLFGRAEDPASSITELGAEGKNDTIAAAESVKAEQ